MIGMLPSHKHFRGKDFLITDPIELDFVEKKQNHVVPMESFSLESKTLTAGEPIWKSSKIATYSNVIGPAGTIPSTNRIVLLVNTEVHTEHPIVLDARHTLIRLLPRSLHQKHFHHSLDYVNSILNMSYAKLGLPRLLRSIEKQCVTCPKRKACTIQPVLSDLPDEHLRYKQPLFDHTGVVYFGRLYVSVRRSTEKKGNFFSCLTTRAVHLEIVSSLDTSACVMGIERSIARRGIPLTIWLDNGTNFVGAEKELLASIENFLKNYLPASSSEVFFAYKTVAWIFNSLRAHHYGGSWERLVRRLKRVLHDILSSRRVTEEVLWTTLRLVEQALNSRPMTPVSADSRELEALTPNHFLFGQHVASFLSLLPGENFDHKKS